MTWFRSEKNTNWGGRLPACPCLVRWPAAIKPGTVSNEIMSHNGLDTHASAPSRGEPDIVNKLKAG